MTLELPSELKASLRKEHEMKEIAMTLRLEPEVKQAIEAVTKLLDVEQEELSYTSSDQDLRDDPPNWGWVENHKSMRISVNGLITRRSIAAHWLANEEVLLKTAAETLAAIEPALVPPHKRPKANVRKTREEDEQELIEGDDKPQAAD